MKGTKKIYFSTFPFFFFLLIKLSWYADPPRAYVKSTNSPFNFFEKKKSYQQSQRKRRRNSDANEGGDSPEPSSLFPSSPAPFFSEADYRNEAEEDDVVDNSYVGNGQDSDEEGIDIFQDVER